MSVEQQSLAEDSEDSEDSVWTTGIWPSSGGVMKGLGVDGSAADDKSGKRPKRENSRLDLHRLPRSMECGWGCQVQRIGEEVAEKLDYKPGV